MAEKLPKMWECSTIVSFDRQKGVLKAMSENQSLTPKSGGERTKLTYGLAGEEMFSRWNNLKAAVANVYYAATWHADRPVDEAGLWTALRDAADFAPGKSPKELPYLGVRAEFPIDRLRILANTIRKSNDFSTEQVHAFLSLYKEDLEARLNTAARVFIEEKLK
jgi:hypothetical protein